MKLKHLVTFCLIASFGAILYGFKIKEAEPVLADRCIGCGTAGLFLVTMPLFLLSASRGKKMKDYMLTEENIKKMREKERESERNR